MRASKKWRGFLAAAVCAASLLAPRPARADKVELETGEVFVGKIIRNSAQEVSIELKSGGVLSFKWSTVRLARKAGVTLHPPAEDGARARDQRPRFAAPPVEKPVPRLPIPPQQPAPTPAQPPEKPHPQKAQPQPKPQPQPQPKPQPPPRAKVVEEDLTAPRPPEPPPVSVQVESVDETLENLVTDETRGFAVAPPEGFVPWTETQSETLPLAFVEPFTRTNFTVAAYRSADSILQVKKGALKSYTEQFKVFNVVRDEKLAQRDKSTPDIWLVEIDSRLGSINVRQIQLFTRSTEHVLILTYSAMGENYAKYLPSFVKSMDTFRFLESPGKAEEEAKP